MLNPSQRILVTGGTGFIGRYVVESLRSEGSNPLVTIFGEGSAGDIVSLDLTNAEQTADLVLNYKPHVVLHLAGVTGNAHPAEKYDQINFDGSVHLLNALHRVGVSRVVMLGTAAEYGSQPTPFREDMPTRPVSPYATSKASINKFALDMHATTGFPVVVLRVFTAYGYGQPHKMFISQLIRHAVLNDHFKMSDGLQRRDFVHIDDVTTAITNAISAENAVGRIINVASGEGIALRDLARKAWAISEADDEKLEIGSVEKTGDDSFDTEADISLAREVLDWTPGPDILSDSDNCGRLLEMIQKMKLDIQVSAAR
jgi:UDP-glucose 4-epimerase